MKCKQNGDYYFLLIDTAS